MGLRVLGSGSSGKAQGSRCRVSDLCEDLIRTKAHNRVRGDRNDVVAQDYDAIPCLGPKP